MMFEFRESGHPVFRSTSPFSRGVLKRKGGGNCQYTIALTRERSFVPSVIKTHIPLNDDPTHKDFLLQRCKERIEKLSQQDRLSKFCSDAGRILDHS